MNLLELNKIINGEYPETGKKVEPVRTITESEFNDFRILQSIDESYYKGITETESYTEYFAAYPLLDLSVEDEIKEDLFYASKLGFFYEGIPCKLVYILRKAIKTYNTPNNAISAIDVRNIQKYIKKGSLPEGVTIKQVMENLLGNSFELLTSYKTKVKYKDVYEIYVENTDRVLIVPEDIAAEIDSREDLMNVKYIKDVGVCVYDMPIRTFNNRVGVTINEYDLRNSK